MNAFTCSPGRGKLSSTSLMLFLAGFSALLHFATSDLTASEKANVKRGNEVYLDNCVPCHGINGDGQGPLGVRLGARDFTKGNFQKGSGDEQIFNTISNGIPPKMPAWKKKLSAQERRDVAAFIRTFLKKKP